MKATKLTVAFREWDKLPDFMEAVNDQEDMLAYELDGTTALLVAESGRDLAWLEAQAEKWFNEYYTTPVK